MKPLKVLLFMVAAFALLALVGVLMPAQGVTVGQVTLRFPSPAALLAESGEAPEENPDSTIARLQQSSQVIGLRSTIDSLKFYKRFTTSDVSRIHFPDGDYTFFDSLFAELRDAAPLFDGHVAGGVNGHFPPVVRAAVARIDHAHRICL